MDNTHSLNLILVQDILELATPEMVVERLAIELTKRDREIQRLRDQASDAAWARDGGDRMGGSFSAWEINRRGDEWS